MITVRLAESDGDLESWRQVRMAVLPDERAQTVEEMRTSKSASSLYLLAEVDGRVAGSGVADRSDLGGQGFLSPRVLPEARRRGVGWRVLLHGERRRGWGSWLTDGGAGSRGGSAARCATGG